MAAPARPAAAAVSGSFALPPDAHYSFDQQQRRRDREDGCAVTAAAVVEECARRRQADDDALLHSLDGVACRLSQLELCCYKLERSIGELRSDVTDYHSHATVNFRCIDESLRQVQKTVQILQDRQDLAEAPKELAKLQIPREISAQGSEATASSVLGARENDRNSHAAKHEVALFPLHQVNAMHSHAVRVQGSNGYALQQHLVPVSLGTQRDQQQQVNQAAVYYTQSQDRAKSSESGRVESVVQVVQHDQQRLNQAPVYYVQSQDHAKCTESKPVESVVQVVHPLVQTPEASRVAVELPQKSSQPIEPYTQAHNHGLQMPTQHVDSHTWHSQQSMVQQQQYIIQQVPQHASQQQSSSPQSQSAPLLYPAYISQKPANPNTEPISKGVALQLPYSSPQQKHHEDSFYGQANTIFIPVADHNIQQHQPQSLQHGLGPCPPQQSKPNHCSIASYTVQGNRQTYSSTYKDPSNCPAAVVPQPPATPMAFHHLGPHVVHNHPFGNMVETTSVVGYPWDRVEILPVVTPAQPVDSSVMVDKLNAGSNVTSPREWAA